MAKTLTDLAANAALMTAIKDSVAKTVSEFAGAACKAGEPAVSEFVVLGAGVASTVRLQGAEYSVELFLQVPSNLLAPLYENAFNEAVDEFSPAARDFAGEILNIAFGTIDPMMRASNVKFKCSFPINFGGATLMTAQGAIQNDGIKIPFTALGKEMTVFVFTENTIKQKWAYTP